MKTLHIKVLRDLSRMRGQLLPIALILASGLGVFVGMRSTMHSLESARSAYYAAQRFGHVFARLVRAPEHVAKQLAAIPGVQRVQTRVVADVTLDIPGLTDAATGRLVSIPALGSPAVNDLYLVRGRMPRAVDAAEVLASEAFVEAHDFALGASLTAIMNGNRQELRIVGVALSPEFTYALPPGVLFPDDKRFGVLWVPRESLAAAFDLEGAFNDVSLRIERDRSVAGVLAEVDRVLERYGGLGSIARAEQQSAFFVENELLQLRTISVMVPVLFLIVAAFLLNVVIGRIITSQREQIATLKAFGYRNREVGLHYALLVGAVVALGCLGGLGLGAWMGGAMTRLYGDYYRFPELPFRLGSMDIIAGLGISVTAAFFGAWSSIRRTVALRPAEGMRPEAPANYRATLMERIGLARLVPSAWRIVLRELERKPLRAAFTIFGVAMATALTIVNTFTIDAIEHMLNVQFGLNQRQDVTLTLVEPRALSALPELEHMPGVIHAEPFRAAPVRLRNGPRQKATAITGVPLTATLSSFLDSDLRQVEIPEEGLTLSTKLAKILEVGVGEMLQVEVLEGARLKTEIRVARIVENYVGLSANMSLSALARLLGEAQTMNGAWLLVDDMRLDELYAAVKATPTVAGVTSRNNLLASVRKLLDESIGVMLFVGHFFSLIMALGVLYNAARVTLAERSRELASMRVLGFRRREVGQILLGEFGLLVAIAIPLGLVIGYWGSAVMAMSPGYNSEQFRIPFVIAPATYARAVLTIVVAALLSGWSTWRKLDRIDLIEVLKSRD